MIRGTVRASAHEVLVSTGLFNDLWRRLETIAALDDWSYVVQGYHTTVLSFAPGRMPSPDEYGASARKGVDIAYALFSAAKRGTAAIAK